MALLKYNFTYKEKVGRHTVYKSSELCYNCAVLFKDKDPFYMLGAQGKCIFCGNKSHTCEFLCLCGCYQSKDIDIKFSTIEKKNGNIICRYGPSTNQVITINKQEKVVVNNNGKKQYGNPIIFKSAFEQYNANIEVLFDFYKFMYHLSCTDIVRIVLYFRNELFY